MSGRKVNERTVGKWRVTILGLSTKAPTVPAQLLKIELISQQDACHRFRSSGGAKGALVQTFYKDLVVLRGENKIKWKNQQREPKDNAFLSIKKPSFM